MGLNKDFIGREFEPLEHVVSTEDIIDYAWAIGARNLSYFNYNGAFAYNHESVVGMAPPSYAVTYELPILEELWSDPDLHGGPDQAKQNVLMLVHGDQKMRFYKPIRPGDKLTYRTKIAAIEDKGSGELLRINVLTTNGNGEKVVESDWGLFIRGIGSGQKPEKSSSNGSNGSKPKAPEEPPELAFRDVIRMPEDITYRYSKASNDMNPIHIDPEVAKEAGLSGIIVHGLCTMSMTMRAIIESYLDSDPAKLKSLGVRFTAPVYPGDVIIVDGWEKEELNGNMVLGFDVTRKSDGIKVIKGGTAEVSLS